MRSDIRRNAKKVRIETWYEIHKYQRGWSEVPRHGLVTGKGYVVTVAGIEPNISSAQAFCRNRGLPYRSMNDIRKSLNRSDVALLPFQFLHYLNPVDVIVWTDRNGAKHVQEIGKAIRSNSRVFRTTPVMVAFENKE